MAEWYRPQLASLVDVPPAGDQWLHEIKFDGYRAGCRIADGQVTLTSRNGIDLTRTFPAIARAGRQIPAREARIDGEIVALLPDGRSSFHALQHLRSSSRDPGPTAALVYMAFDLLSLDGRSLISQPLAERKARLEGLLAAAPVPAIRYSTHVVGQGPAFYEQARQLALEGVVSKRVDLPYRPGRSDSWRKAKCVRAQEFVVGGFTDRAGTSDGLGALLLGCYDGAGLVYAGRVGTGWSARESEALRARLERLARKSCPFTPAPAGALARSAHWVTPSLVAQVAFTEWTPDGMVRHPTYHGLRTDRAPADIQREEPGARSRRG